MIERDAKNKREIKALGLNTAQNTTDLFPLSEVRTTQDPYCILLITSPAANGASSEARGAALHSLMNNVVTCADGNCANALSDKLLRGAQVAA